MTSADSDDEDGMDSDGEDESDYGGNESTSSDESYDGGNESAPYDEESGYSGNELATDENGSGDGGDEPVTYENEPGGEDESDDDENGSYIDDSPSKEDDYEINGSQTTEHLKDAGSGDEGADSNVSGQDTDEARDSDDKQIKDSTSDKSKGKGGSDAVNNHQVPPDRNKDKSTEAEKDNERSYDSVRKDNNKDESADKKDPASDTGSSSAGTSTGDSGTSSANSRSVNNSNDSDSSGSSSDSSAASIVNIQVSNPKNESGAFSNVSPTASEDPEFVDDFRESKEAYGNVEITDYSFAPLVKGREAVFKFGLEKNNVVSISFVPEVSGGQAKAVVEILKNTSTLINEAPPGIVYKNLNIWVGDAQFSPYKTTDAKVNFKVAKEWLLSNNVDPETIVLYGHVNGWNPLVTEKTGEDNAYMYYTAQTSSFSSFAIVSTGTNSYLADDRIADRASSTGGSSDMAGGTAEVPYYNTYRSAALLLVSLFVAGAAGMTGLKYMTRLGISGKSDETDSMQFKK